MKVFFEHVRENRWKCATVVATVLATLRAIRSDLLGEAIRTDRVGFYLCFLARDLGCKRMIRVC